MSSLNKVPGEYRLRIYNRRQRLTRAVRQFNVWFGNEDTNVAELARAAGEVMECAIAVKAEADLALRDAMRKDLKGRVDIDAR